MISIILGLIFIAFTVFSVLPMGPLAWGSDVVNFLKGSIPVLAAFVGLSVFSSVLQILKTRKKLRKKILLNQNNR